MSGIQESQSDTGWAGEARGHISLEQAWILALQQARDNREFYGRYAEDELSWDMISADEIGDDFEVRLAFRSAGNFRGSGIELFVIEKTGRIKSRRIIRSPRMTPAFIAASIAIVVVAVAGAIFGGLSATGSQDTADAITNTSVIAPTPLATTVAIKPESLARLVSPNGVVSIELDAETVHVPTQLAYVVLSAGEIPTLPAKFTATGTAFELTIDAPLLKPITITVALSDADVALAAGNADNIVIQHHVGGAWTPLATVVDFAESTATANVDHLSMFALTVLEPDPTPTSAPLPAQAALPTVLPAPTFTPTIISPVVAMPTMVATPQPTATLAPTPEATPVPVPAAVPVPLPTPTPVPPATLVPVQEWLLENVIVAEDNVSVFVRILGSARFDITLDGKATGETIIDGSLRADVFRNVPPGNHVVRVFTVGLPDQEDYRRLQVMPPTPTLAPTPTAAGPPTATPVPTYRIFVNGIPVQALNRLLQTDAGRVTLSHAPKSDGAYKVGTVVTLAASSSPGFIVAWGGVDTQRGAFATVEMVVDRYVTVRMSAPTPTPSPTRTPFPWDIPTATPLPTAVPLPTPLPVPTAGGVFVSAAVPTATPVPVPTATLLPTATPTPLPPGVPTPTPPRLRRPRRLRLRPVLLPRRCPPAHRFPRSILQRPLVRQKEEPCPRLARVHTLQAPR